MSRPAALFWNTGERRPRALWRLLLYVLLVATIANPLILLLDATGRPLLEASLENVLAAVGFGVALVISARFIERRPLRDFGLHLVPAWWVELGAGVALGGVIVALAFAALYLAGWVVVRDTARTTIVATPFLLAFAGQVLRYAGGGFFEELFSRGYLLRLVAELGRGARMSRAGAVLLATVVTSLFFGAFHAFNPGASLLSVVNLSLLGLLFAVPMAVTGRLGLSIGLHLGWNLALNTVFGLPNSGKPSNTAVLVTENAGPAVWTGGSFGPEGGLVVSFTLVLVLLVVGAWLGARKGGPGWALALADPPPRAPATESLRSA